ncbi:hypothetical protein [Campylobacter mucosalis]|uniref:hypothetical protein n=1 Tax=Campylobacter mucosalis TaxID=202 RepID=UPI00201DE845|nr:hypothetical protein [Campylobacter mucosalis]
MRYIFLTLFSLLAILGCGVNVPQQSKTYQVTILSPMIKINDIGFLHEYKNSINLQIYNSGVNTANIKIADKICINSVCFSKSEFNQKFFLDEHYDEIFKDIIKTKPIYSGKNLVKTECGYTQNLKNDTITYSFCQNQIKFIDTKNRIKIIIKELQ